MSEFRECVKDISKDCEERNIVITEINYEEELHEVYSQDRDNNGLIHGIYYYDNLYVEPPEILEVRWYETEEERNRQFETEETT